MPIYNYKAINDKTRTIRGEITAANDIDLEERLKVIGLILIDFKLVKVGKGGFFSKIRLRDMLVMCLHMEQLSRAGVPLMEAIADVRDAADAPKLRDVLTDVFESVKSGDMLSQAMAKHPKIFDSVFVGLVKAGEKTGNLAESFNHLADHLKWTSEIRRKVKKAMGYPIFLGITITIVISVLMVFMVPKLTAFIEGQGFSIPIHTRALIWLSRNFAENWYYIFGVPIAIFFTLITCYRTSETFAYHADSFILRVPAIGSTLKKIDLARFSHFFSVMFRSGIDILESLSTAKNVVNNRVLKESVQMVRDLVSEGNSLTGSLRLSGRFPNLVIRMFKIGEDSGNMNESLDNINFFYDKEVNDAVDKMIAMIQPAMIIILGGIILWIVAAMFGPLYDSLSKMNI